MSVVDLTRRITDDENRYQKCLRSAESLIYINPKPTVANQEPVTTDLTIGSTYFDLTKGCEYKIPEKGLKLKSGRCAVVHSLQQVDVPHNVFGLVTGKGRLIFKGVLISTGKIDPGFRDNLRIGVFNGGSETLLLKVGEPLCSVCFFSMESHVSSNPRPHVVKPEIVYAKKPLSERFKSLWSDNWKNLAPLIVSILSLLVALFKK